MDGTDWHSSDDAPRICVIIFTDIVDVTELASKDILNELLYADDLVLNSKTIEGLSYRFLK